MFANRVLNVLLGVTSVFVMPLQLVTTFVLGLFVTLTFGLLLIPIGAIWMIFFLGPLLALSWICNRLPFLREPIGFVGIPLAWLGNVFVALMPSMGEMDSRYSKLIICQTWPYTWEYFQFMRSNFSLPISKDLEDILDSLDPVLRGYLRSSYQDVSQEPSRT